MAVVEVIEQENLMNNALQIGNWLTEQLKQIPDLKNVRGRGLMIGFDVPAALPELKKSPSQTTYFYRRGKAECNSLTPVACFNTN